MMPRANDEFENEFYQDLLQDEMRAQLYITETK